MPAPAMQKEPDRTGVAWLFADGVRFAGQMRFIHLQRVGLLHDAVDHEAIARLDADDIVEHDAAHRHIDPFPITPAAHGLLRQRRQLIQLALGVEFLDHAEEGIGDDAEAGEEGGGVVAQGDDDNQQRTQDDVEEIEHILAEDRPITAADAGFEVIGVAAADALLDFACAQASDCFAVVLGSFDCRLHGWHCKSNLNYREHRGHRERQITDVKTYTRLVCVASFRTAIAWPNSLAHDGNCRGDSVSRPHSSQVR